MQMFYDRMVVPAEQEQPNYNESKKSVVELGQRFLKTNNFSRSYTLRTLFQLFLTVGMSLGLGSYGFKHIKENVS